MLVKVSNLLILSLLVVGSVHAQSQTELEVDSVHAVSYGGIKDNVFAGFHFGGNTAFGENIRYKSPGDVSKFFRLGGALSLGKFFTPAFGLRGTLGLYRQCGIAEQEPREAYPEYYGDGVYNFWNANANVDVLINLYHLFYPHRDTPKFNVIPLFGVGTSYTFGFDKDKLARFEEAPAPYHVDTKASFYPSMRVGFLLSYWLNDRFELQMDAHFDFIDDKYNGVSFDRKYDGYMVAMIGLAYKFHRGTHRYTSTNVVLNDAVQVNRVNADLSQARRDLAAAEQLAPDTTFRLRQEQILEMTVSFNIDRFNITDVQRPNVEAVARYIRLHPEVDVVICGFADYKTAYPAYNMRLSKRRVMAVYNMLTQQFGIDPKRLSVDYKGDTEQPYQMENRWNRVVVFKLTPHQEYKNLE